MPAKKTVNDVDHPSKKAAEPTSRPIIVGHGPMIEDPTLKQADKPVEKEDEEKKLATAHKDKVIEAPGAAKTEPETEQKPTDEAPVSEVENEAEEAVAETTETAEATETDAKPATETKDTKKAGKGEPKIPEMSEEELSRRDEAT